MLDIKYIKENQKEVEKALAKKPIKSDIPGLIKAYDKKTLLQRKLEHLQSEHNKINREVTEIARKNKGKVIISQEMTERISKVTKPVKKILHDLGKAEIDYDQRMAQIHNLPDKTTPAGENEKDNKVVKQWGKIPEFRFKLKDHMALGEDLDIIDKKRGVKVSGARFTYLKNEAFQLQFALVRYLQDKLIKKGFIPMIPPILVKEQAMFGTGFFPAEEGEYYKTEGEDLYLAGTAEVPLAAYHADEILAEKDLPLKYMGYSSCFRREAGNYGKDTKGILRVHQFDKIEMFIYATQDQSWEIYEKELSAISEEILQELNLPYQKLLMSGGDIGMPNAKKYDFEAWFPAQEKYRELMSCSHDTDFQARRLGIRYKDGEGNTQFVHTMNNTALAIGRTIIAILGNYQQADGSVRIPKALWKYTGFKVIKSKK